MKYIKPDWPAPANIHAYTTSRLGWGHSRHATPESTHQLKTLLQLPTDPIWIDHIHGATAIEAIPENQARQADASFTHHPNRVCVVTTADCLPILICNQQGTRVAAIHAGWRGLAHGIIESTLHALQQPPETLLVWLGPAIGPQKFEVGPDVYDAFTQHHADAHHAFTPIASGKWLANLYALANMRLALHGITQIYGGQFCTFTQSDLFFSYRRDQGKTGRMASVIWIADAL